MNNFKSSHFEPWCDELLKEAHRYLERGFDALPDGPRAESNPEEIKRVLESVAERLRDNYPYFHPLYAGQMLKPPHPIAQLAYILALSLNPNNHALDGGRASSAMEKEAVGEIARMFGWETYLGHLCSGGTMANLEALWVSRQLRPGQKIVASSQAHYTHARMCAVLGVEFDAAPCDAHGRLDLRSLTGLLESGDVGTVVATLGSTATGSVDPLFDLLELRRRFGFRLHADAAYGGYFQLAGNLGAEARRAFDIVSEVDSIVIDPHKHGLQPYGCGCVLFKDPTIGKLYKHDSPYTYFSSAELHLGEISLECSRAGAAAVALWATLQLLPLVKGGPFARMLESCRTAALSFYSRIQSDKRFITAFPPELDIVVWAPRASRTSQISELARRLFDEAARRQLHLALAKLPVDFFDFAGAGIDIDTDTVTALRSVLMKPEHNSWIDPIWTILDEAMDAVSPSAR